MEKVSNDNVCIKGSSLVLGITFPSVDGIYTLKSLYEVNRLKVYYYIVNTSKKIDVSKSLYFLPNLDEEDNIVFNVDTSNLHTGVLMVEIIAKIPMHDGIEERLEIARCSSGIAIVD